MTDALLTSLSEVLDIGALFPRVSASAQQLLPHDGLGLFGRDAGNGFTLAASSGSLPELRRMAFAEPGEFQIVEDLAREPGPVIGLDPPDFRERALAAGYRSLLNVRSQTREHALGLGFFSKAARSYREGDVKVARCVLELVALALEQAARRPQPMAASERAPIIGASAVFRRALEQALQVAVTPATTLLTGESGTGKEVLAQLIHARSPRRSGPFVALNCAALPDTLLESELFGYERGAFTGAQGSKPGQLELAAGGTLFLDEVGELSPLAQAKFLRVLQEREFKRLGGTRLLHADVRVIAATNRDLWQAVGAKAFREDLYYRLNVVDIELPPLRARREDIPLLTDAFLRELGRAPEHVSADVRARLAEHAWPGNVRELRNVLERAVILSAGQPLAREHLSLHASARPVALAAAIERAEDERARIEDALKHTDWNVAKSAKRLGLTRTQLYLRLRKYQLERPAYDASSPPPSASVA